MIGYHSSVGSSSCVLSVAIPSVELQDDTYQILSIVLGVVVKTQDSASGGTVSIARPEHAGPAEGRDLTSLTHTTRIYFKLVSMMRT